jgi:hypothetical protein
VGALVVREVALYVRCGHIFSIQPNPLHTSYYVGV